MGANVHRRQATLGDVQRASSQVDAHAGRHQAMSSVRMKLIWEQEAAGSNPAIPTDCKDFSNVLRDEQQLLQMESRQSQVRRG